MQLTPRTPFVPRSEWGARPATGRAPINATFGTTIHWEGPQMGIHPHSACASYVRGIQRFHMDTRGWTDIAYSAVVCPHGYVFEGRWVNRKTGANGTNVGNATAYAICYLGGQGDPFTPEARVAIYDATVHLRSHGGAGPGVNCHRDWKPTACPGDFICTWVKNGLKISNTPTVPTTPQEDDLTDEEKMLLAAASSNAIQAKESIQRIEQQLFGKEGGRKLLDEVDALIRGLRVLLMEQGIDPAREDIKL